MRATTKPKPRSTIADRRRDLPIPIKARRHPMIAAFVAGLERCGVNLNQGSPKPTHLVLGVSGGADSLALLFCAAIVHRHRKTKSKLIPHVVHVHHHLRESADDDADFVKKLCDRLDIDCRVEHVHPKTRKGNLSANARTLRYAALKRIAEEVNASAVAVAHHVEDQAETVLAALCRGAGIDGLSGMPSVRPLSKKIMRLGLCVPGTGVPGLLSLIRPLLHVHRSDCEELCRAAGIAWRDDASNLDRSKNRNRLRHDVMPILNSMWPGASSHMGSAAEIIGALQPLLEARLAEAFGPLTQTSWSRDQLRSLEAAILMAGLRRAAVALVPAVSDQLSWRILNQAATFIRSKDRSPHRFHWASNLELAVQANRVEFRTRATSRRQRAHG